MSLLKIALSFFLLSLTLFLYQNCGNPKALQSADHGNLFSTSRFETQVCSKNSVGTPNIHNGNLRCEAVYTNDNYTFSMEPSWDGDRIPGGSSSEKVFTRREQCSMQEINELNALGSGKKQFFVNAIGEVCVGSQQKLVVYAWRGDGNTGVGNQYRVCTQPVDGRSPESCRDRLYQVCREQGGRRISMISNVACRPNNGAVHGCGSGCKFFVATGGAPPSLGPTSRVPASSTPPATSPSSGGVFEYNGLPWRITTEADRHCRLRNWTGINKSNLDPKPGGITINFENNWCDQSGVSPSRPPAGTGAQTSGVFEYNGLPWRITNEADRHCRLRNWTSIDKSNLDRMPVGITINFNDNWCSN